MIGESFPNWKDWHVMIVMPGNFMVSSIEMNQIFTNSETWCRHNSCHVMGRLSFRSTSETRKSQVMWPFHVPIQRHSVRPKVVTSIHDTLIRCYKDMMILWFYDVIDVLPGTFQQFHTIPKTMTQLFHSKSSEFSQKNAVAWRSSLTGTWSTLPPPNR